MRFEEWDFKKEDDQVIIAGFVAESYKFPSGVYLNSSAVKKIEIGKNKLVVRTRTGHAYELYFESMQQMVRQKDLVEKVGEFGITKEVAEMIVQTSKQYWTKLKQQLSDGKMTVKLVGFMPTCVLFGKQDTVCRCNFQRVSDFVYNYTDSEGVELIQMKLDPINGVEVLKVAPPVKELELHTVDATVKGLPTEPEKTGVTTWIFNEK